MSQPRLRIPHTLLLLFSMVLVAQILGYLLPPGVYQRVENEQGREQVVAGTYQHLEDAERLSPFAAFTAIPQGFAEAQDIIFFIFIIGGAFGVLRATGAVDAAIGRLLERLGHRPDWLIGGTMAAFALGSATIGMAEEYIPFVPVLVVLAVGLGLDAVSAVGIVCVGYGVGYGAALINPFTVLIAQDVAEVPPSSGWEVRAVLLGVFFIVGFLHVRSYARRVRENPDASLVRGVPLPETVRLGGEPAPLSARRIAVLSVLLVTLVILVHGIQHWHWYLVEMGALFLGLSVLLAAVAGLSPDGGAEAFCSGAAELTSTALLVGFARSIEVVLDQGQVIDTVIHAVAQPLQSLGPAAAAVGMLAVQSLTNLFIPSGSGQAYVTMPLMAPLADLVGVSRQVAVLAYQFGDGFTNILVPTNAVLIGILSMAGVPYDRWLRFVLPFMLKVWALAAVALVLVVVAGSGLG